jgi:transcriptional regulator with XRE-family HTH domain
MPERGQRGRPRKARPPGLSGELGAMVERLRKERGLSADTLGSEAGLGIGTVIRVERGEQSPTFDTILAIAHALGISGAELLADCPAWSEQPKTKGKGHAAPKP